MGSPPRIFREVELMDIDNLFEAYIRDHNPEYLNGENILYFYVIIFVTQN